MNCLVSAHQCLYTLSIVLIILIFNIKIIHSVHQCPELALPEYGFFFSGYCEREVGALCGIGCLTGYRRVEGDSFHECQQNETWTGRSLRCEEIRCPSLKLDNQVIQKCSPEQSGIDSKFGTKCRASCRSQNYRLVGPPTRECLVLSIWSGYEQFCIFSNETQERFKMAPISHELSSSTIMTTTQGYDDYSNYALNINKTSIALSLSQSSHFTIIFWFYIDNVTDAALISLQDISNTTLFEITARQNKLTFHHASRNQTQPTSIKMPMLKWINMAWTYSNIIQQSYLYIDGARQQSFDFRMMNFDFKNISSLKLFGRTFRGLLTRLEVWNEMIPEPRVLISYRDCRKLNGDVFSWSKVSGQTWLDTKQLKASSFCSGCSEPDSIQGGTYHVSDYNVGSSVEYKCNYAHEMVGASRLVCMVSSEWYPPPPTCQYKPCTTNCDLCQNGSGICLREKIIIETFDCDPPCDDDEECIDGECTWSNTSEKWMSTLNDNICDPPCPLGIQCINQRCEQKLPSMCTVPCQSGQICINGRCGCYRGLCDNDRPCYELCEIGERCYNWSCSCGTRGKCGTGETCLADVCMCGVQRGGCHPHEHCVQGKCVCKTNLCDRCNNTCKSTEICLNGKCVCKEQCEQSRPSFCPFPCLNGGQCSGFYQCTCRQGWQGHRCEQRTRNNATIS